MPTITARATSGGTVVLSDFGKGLPVARVMVYSIHAGWTNPAAGVPTEAYLTLRIGTTDVIVAAKAVTSAANLRDSISVDWPQGIACGDKNFASTVKFFINGTSPNPMDLTVTYETY